MCGLRFDDFCLLTPFEFQAVLDAYNENEQRRSRDLWECMRVLAAVGVSPFSKGRVVPRSLIKFPWDCEVKSEERRMKNQKPITKEDDKARFESLLHRINGSK